MARKKMTQPSSATATSSSSAARSDTAVDATEPTTSSSSSPPRPSSGKGSGKTPKPTSGSSAAANPRPATTRAAPTAAATASVAPTKTASADSGETNPASKKAKGASAKSARPSAALPTRSKAASTAGKDTGGQSSDDDDDDDDDDDASADETGEMDEMDTQLLAKVAKVAKVAKKGSPKHASPRASPKQAAPSAQVKQPQHPQGDNNYEEEDADEQELDETDQEEGTSGSLKVVDALPDIPIFIPVIAEWVFKSIVLSNQLKSPSNISSLGAALVQAFPQYLQSPPVSIWRLMAKVAGILRSSGFPANNTKHAAYSITSLRVAMEALQELSKVLLEVTSQFNRSFMELYCDFQVQMCMNIIRLHHNNVDEFAKLLEQHFSPKLVDKPEVDEYSKKYFLKCRGNLLAILDFVRKTNGGTAYRPKAPLELIDELRYAKFADRVFEFFDRIQLALPKPSLETLHSLYQESENARAEDIPARVTSSVLRKVYVDVLNGSEEEWMQIVEQTHPESLKSGVTGKRSSTPASSTAAAVHRLEELSKELLHSGRDPLKDIDASVRSVSSFERASQKRRAEDAEPSSTRKKHAGEDDAMGSLIQVGSSGKGVGKVPKERMQQVRAVLTPDFASSATNASRAKSAQPSKGKAPVAAPASDDDPMDEFDEFDEDADEDEIESSRFALLSAQVKNRHAPLSRNPVVISTTTSSLASAASRSANEERMKTTTGSRARIPFSRQEVENLKAGIEEFGVGRWKEIHERYQFERTRLPIDLKDKYRNMKKKGEI